MVKQLDIFGNEVEIEIVESIQPNSRSLTATMNEIWGTLENKRCGECKHFLRLRYHGKTYFKCELWSITQSTATDKRIKDIACKRWEEK